MYRFSADNAWNMLFSYPDLSADCNRGIHAAHRLYTQCAVTVDVCHDHSNFIHMCADHQLMRRTLLTAFFHQQIAERIDRPSYAVQFGKFRDQIAANCIFIAGRCAQITERFKMLQHTPHLLK